MSRNYRCGIKYFIEAMAFKIEEDEFVGSQLEDYRYGSSDYPTTGKGIPIFVQSNERDEIEELLELQCNLL